MLGPIAPQHQCKCGRRFDARSAIPERFFGLIRGFGAPVRFDQEWAMVSKYYFGAVEESDVPLNDGLANCAASMGTFCRTSSICIE